MSKEPEKAKSKSAGGKSRFPLKFSVIFTFVFILLYWPNSVFLQVNGIFDHMEDVYADKLFFLRSESLKPGDPRIILIALDVETGKKFSFPVPRAVQARLLDKFKSFGVRTAVFDVLFHEPREGDAELAAATKRFGRVIHLFDYETKETDHGPVVSVNLPIPGLRSAAQYLGYPNVQDVLDSDGHLRQAKLFEHRFKDPLKDDRFAPSMDAAAIASFRDEPLSNLLHQYADPAPKIMLLNFRKPQEWSRHPKADLKILSRGTGQVQNLETIDSPYQTISALDVLNDDLTPKQRSDLKGAIAIVGSTALGYFDHYPSPFNPSAPGFEYHANVQDNILHGDFVQRVARGWMLLAIVVMIWLPLLFLRLSPAAGNMVTGGVMLGWFAFAYFQAARDVRVDTIAPAVALGLSFLVQTVYRVLTEGQEKKFIKQTFGQFVSPDVVEKLIKDPSLVKLGGEKREMTVFFLDIAHFTTISEKMAPDALIIFLNKYLSALSHVVQERKGTVDKYIGDCIMAFWNAPLDDANHHVNACLAAIECQAIMKDLNVDLDPSLTEKPAIRIGLNSGDMTVGLTGSEKKLAYTVLGDEVNLASRLEGANKFFGSHIMISEATYKGAEAVVEGRELGKVRVVGKAIPIRVFELLAKKGELSPEWQRALPLYNKGMEHFTKAAYGDALSAFEEVIKIFPEDGPATFYLNTSRDYSVLPPDGWDGVINLTAK